MPPGFVQRERTEQSGKILMRLALSVFSVRGGSRSPTRKSVNWSTVFLFLHPRAVFNSQTEAAWIGKPAAGRLARR